MNTLAKHFTLVFIVLTAVFIAYLHHSTSQDIGSSRIRCILIWSLSALMFSVTKWQERRCGMSIFKGMGNNSVGLLMMLMAVLMISTYATAQTGLHSSTMKGSIIALEDSNVYICIGSRDGAKVGQELDVYNIGAKPMVYKGSPSFERKHTGKIRIIEVLDEHFARAILVSGKAEIAYIVELTNH
jgi:uncharacterized RmlC-like cupin family protein